MSAEDKLIEHIFPCGVANGYEVWNSDFKPDVHSVNLVCYPDWMAIESAVAALASTIDGIECVGFSKAQTKDRTLSSVINSTISKNAHYGQIIQVYVLLLGSYWTDGGNYKLKDSMIVDLPRNADITMYCHGANSEICYTFSKFEHRSKEQTNAYRINKCLDGKDNREGPCSFIVSWMRSVVESGKLPSLFEGMLKSSQGSTLVRLVDGYQMQTDMVEAEKLFTGIYNYARFPSQPVNNFDKFRFLFLHMCSVKDVMDYGSTVLDVELKIVHNRVAGNAALLPLKDGTMVAICPSPDMTVLTHRLMHERYPEVAGSVTITHRFGDGAKTMLNWSIRAYDDGMNAETLAKKIGGGGAKDSAGATVTVTDFTIPF
ncbi:MAG: hypothetical protein PHN45_00075 [Methylococcales bacterium]|nr:hypothetical protein [Methylococcales bacterium]